jgi:hypothetical protein
MTSLMTMRMSKKCSLSDKTTREAAVEADLTPMKCRLHPRSQLGRAWMWDHKLAEV